MTPTQHARESQSTSSRWSERTRERASLLAVMFLVATIPNTVEAFTDIDGTWWTVLRVIVSTLFTGVLLALAVSAYSDWRRARGDARRT